MKVEETRGGKFEVWVSSRYDPDGELDLAELVELRSACDRALMDYLARNVAKLTASEAPAVQGKVGLTGSRETASHE